MSSGLVIIAITNTLYWNRVYDANLEHMQNVRIAAAHYLTETVPPSQILAAFDVGAVRYYSDRPVIDLGGLIDPALGEVYRADVHFQGLFDPAYDQLQGLVKAGCGVDGLGNPKKEIQHRRNVRCQLKRFRRPANSVCTAGKRAFCLSCRSP